MLDWQSFAQASYGNQRRRSKIARLRGKSFFSWNQGLPFAAALPMKKRNFKLLLCEVDKEKQRSQLLAIAFIPLYDLMEKSETSGSTF